VWGKKERSVRQVSYCSLAHAHVLLPPGERIPYEGDVQIVWLSTPAALDGYKAAVANVSLNDVLHQPGTCVLSRVFDTERVTLEFCAGRVMAEHGMRPSTASEFVAQIQELAEVGAVPAAASAHSPARIAADVAMAARIAARAQSSESSLCGDDEDAQREESEEQEEQEEENEEEEEEEKEQEQIA
jgi:hypothetical protein